MGSEVTVRRAGEGDVRDIQRVARRSWEATYEDVLDPGSIDVMLAEGYSTELLEETVAASETDFFVATLDDEVVGYVSAMPDESGDVGEVNVYVDPEHWREGIGTRLLDRAEEALADRGVDRVRDYVLAENDAGNAFYRSRFEKTGERELAIGEETYVTNVYVGTIE